LGGASRWLIGGWYLLETQADSYHSCVSSILYFALSNKPVSVVDYAIIVAAFS